MSYIRPGVIRRACRSLREQGVLASLAHYGHVVQLLAKDYTPAGRRRANETRIRDEEFARKRALIDADFDSCYGVDTGG